MTDKREHRPLEVAIVSGGNVRTAERSKIRRLVNDDLATRTDEPYHKAQVQIEHASDGHPEALVVSLLRAKSYSADIFRVKVDSHFNTVSVEALS